MVKKILFSAIVMASSSFGMKAQQMGYIDVGSMFARDGYAGNSARYTAMGGAFTALGGDFSSVLRNPAGAAVFSKSTAQITLSYLKHSIESNYYKSHFTTDNDQINFDQAAINFVFGDIYSNQSKKASFGVIYQRLSDYNLNWVANGNSQFATFTGANSYAIGDYTIAKGQSFTNQLDGFHDVTNVFFATQALDNLYLGVSVDLHYQKMFQLATLEELNDDDYGDELYANLQQELATSGSGVSLSFGLIAKPFSNLRFGFSYATPTWYSLSESFIDTKLHIETSDGNYYNDYSGIIYNEYNLTTPSRTQLGMALIFGKNGLVSADYIYKDYSGIRLNPGNNLGNNFSNENYIIKHNLNKTSSFNLGTEWRYDKVSFRAGYHYQQRLFKNAPDSENTTGYAIGLGYTHNAFIKFDIAYDHSNYESYYDFYPGYNDIQGATLDNKVDRIVGTLTYRF